MNAQEEARSKKAVTLTAQQLSERLGISLRHVRRLDSSGKLPRPFRLGRSVRWSVIEIDNWMGAGAPDRQKWNQMKGREE